MGNSTSGFGVLNLSTFDVNIGLSMAATHYYENKVGHGEIFYRWPGAVHYTVYAQIAPEITDGTCTKEIVKASLLGITSVGAAALAIVALPAIPALAGPAASFVLAAEGGAAGLATTAGLAAGSAVAADYAIAKQVFDVMLTVDPADTYAEMKGCYGGGSGTWLVLRGGPYKGRHGGHAYEKLRLEVSTPEFIAKNGNFTSYSRKQFYTTEESKKLHCEGHSCGRTNCKSIN